jgi:hypothetical protein
VQRIRSFTQIIDIKSLLICGLAVLSTWICMRFDIVADFPLTLIATAIVFPIVFSIGTAYRRRDSALEEYASLKAHGRALYLAARDWLPEDPAAHRTETMQTILGNLLRSCRDMFTHPLPEMPAYEGQVYREISNLSLFVEQMRDAGLATNEISRCNQYLSRIALSFERMKHIYQYRTPRTLRAFSTFFIFFLPLIYGPYFAYQAKQYGPGLAYVTPILFVLVLVGLANIQNHLENPFDRIGADDVAINAEKFVASLDSGGD